MGSEYQNIQTKQDLFSSHRPINEKIFNLFTIIAHLTQEVGYCYAFNTKLASLVGVSHRTVVRYIRKVEKLGYIRTTVNKKRAYWRYIYVTKKGWDLINSQKADINSNDINYNIITKEYDPSQDPDISIEKLTKAPLCSFSSSKIKKIEGEIEKLEKIRGELRLEITEMWKSGVSVLEINKFEGKCGNLERIIAQMKCDAEQLREKKWKEMVLAPYRGFKRVIVRLFIECDARGLNFERIYREIMDSVVKGSLSVCKATGEKMGLSMGFNIAMKLIREKKWRTPACYSR